MKEIVSFFFKSREFFAGSKIAMEESIFISKKFR